jgi:hypothetical protein
MKYLPVKEMAMVMEGGHEAPMDEVYVKPFGGTVERVEQLIENIEDDISQALYGNLVEALRGRERDENKNLEETLGYIGEVERDLESYGRAVAVYDRKDELGIVAKENHPEYRSDGGWALAETLDEYTKRTLISGDEGWLEYYRGIRDEVESYPVSSEEQNTFVQRIAMIRTLSNDYLGSVGEHNEFHREFFGGELWRVVGKLAEKVRRNNSGYNETQVYEKCSVEYERMVGGLETLAESWDLEDQGKAEEEGEVEGVVGVSAEMEALKKHFRGLLEKLKAITVDKLKVIEAQVEIYTWFALAEYVYNNYGKMDNIIEYIDETTTFKRTKPTTTNPGKISVQFVQLGGGEWGLRLSDYVKANGSSPLIPQETI